MAHASSPPVVRWDWLQLCAPGFPDNSQILGPLCGCQEQRALMIAHCHWSRARSTQAQKDLQKPECLWGQRRGIKSRISVFFRCVLSTIYLSVIHNNNPISIQSVKIFFRIGMSFRIPLLVKNIFCVRYCSSRFMHDVVQQYSGLFFFVYSLVAQTASWDMW